MMGKHRPQDGNTGCSNGSRELRKTIYDLVKSQGVITVDNTDDPDPAGLLQVARERLLDRVRDQATKRHWGPEQESAIVGCITKLVRFQVASNCLTTEAVTRHHEKGKKPVTMIRNQRVKDRSELSQVAVLISLEPHFRKRLDQALSEVSSPLPTTASPQALSASAGATAN